MRSSLLGAHAQDPVVPDGRSIPDRPWRVGRRHDGPAPMLDAPSDTRMTLVEGDPTAAGARAEERRAACVRQARRCEAGDQPASRPGRSPARPLTS